MADPSSGVVENLGLGESLVATFVSENPQASAEKPLYDSVQEPSQRTNRSRRNVLGSNESIKQVEAVLWNGISDVVDSIIGKLELISQRVDQLSVTFVLHIVQRRH